MGEGRPGPGDRTGDLETLALLTSQAAGVTEEDC